MLSPRLQSTTPENTEAPRRRGPFILYLPAKEEVKHYTVCLGSLTILRETNLIPDFLCFEIDQNAGYCRGRMKRKE